ncbi:MAG: signal peptidase I [Oscillospiraceae bacterium]|jgi:signal peptidase I|nr:signal peptidase I [Oscillospiraceae bacterium]MCI9288289.1 signal peptidase I [Oscillospiraceae bacterium]MCI9551685.1 signal peptidase I [Oscillospiraceae bacterium]
MGHWESEAERNSQARPAQPAQEGGEPSGGKPRRETSGGRELYMNVRVLVSMMAVFVMMFTFVARIIVVSGPSMENTLWGGDLILVWGLGYTPKQGDVVVLTQESYQEDSIVKRVIATGGQRVDIDYGANAVRVDGELLEEDYIKEQMFVPGYGEGINHVTVPEGCLFVMGDNRNESADSRYPDIGIVDTRCVIGRGVAVMFPLEHWKRL